jgi:hypothetical protein
MTPLAPLAFLAAARAVVGANPDQDVLAKRSAWADDPARSSAPSAAFVHHVGNCSRGSRGARGGPAWPFPIDADCAVMHRIATRYHVVRTRPLPGRIHLKWNQERHRFVRAGIVIQSERVILPESLDYLYKILVFEGEATLTPIGTRQFTTLVWSRVAFEWNIPTDGDRCIDWTLLDSRVVAAAKPTRAVPFRSVTPWRRRVS